MGVKGCVGMVLAGGFGERLGALSRYYSKPAIHFGGKNRIIDFTLNNCRYSGIGTVGVLSQQFSTGLQSYITDTYKDTQEYGDIHILPPEINMFYTGTADAVYKNIEFIERFQPECVLILSGDLIYKMDYRKMLDFHRKTGATVTLASTPVPINEATPRFGIVNADAQGRVYSLDEKLPRAKNCLVSMGVYAFKWNALKHYLLEDQRQEKTRHDFARNILPGMLCANESMYTYQYDGYWRDIGTVASLWEANMDQLSDPSACRLHDVEREAQDHVNITYNYIPSDAIVHESIIAGGCSIFGRVEHSVLCDSISVEPGAEVVNSVVMPGVFIGSNVKIHNAVVGTDAVIMDNAAIGADDGVDYFIDHKTCPKGISLVAPWTSIAEGMRFQKGSHISTERLGKWINGIEMGKGKRELTCCIF